jgi:hypothetical protein
MAKVRAPLFSAGASGTFRNLIEFRTLGNMTVATGRAKKKRIWTKAQSANRLRFSNAIIAWRTLSQDEKSEWSEAAQIVGSIGYRYFLSEYSCQGITEGGCPLIP